MIPSGTVPTGPTIRNEVPLVWRRDLLPGDLRYSPRKQTPLSERMPLVPAGRSVQRKVTARWFAPGSVRSICRKGNQGDRSGDRLTGTIPVQGIRPRGRVRKRRGRGRNRREHNERMLSRGPVRLRKRAGPPAVRSPARNSLSPAFGSSVFSWFFGNIPIDKARYLVYLYSGKQEKERKPWTFGFSLRTCGA